MARQNITDRFLNSKDLVARARKNPGGLLDVMDSKTPGFGVRKPVPVASDAERPLPDARRKIAGSSEG